MSGNNKTVLIIGGSRGIGRKIAEKLSDTEAMFQLSAQVEK